MDIGDGVLHTVVVYDGYCVKHATQRVDMAGRDLTQYMKTLLMEIGLNIESSSGFEIARDIKEKSCYVSIDFEMDLVEYEKSDKNDMKYELPDGQEVTIKSQRIKCPEALFNPSLLGNDSNGIHKLIYESVQKSDIDIRKNLL